LASAFFNACPSWFEKILASPEGRKACKILLKHKAFLDSFMQYLSQDLGEPFKGELIYALTSSAETRPGQVVKKILSFSNLVE